MTHKSGFLSTAKPRQRLEASLLFALRAVAQSARSVQSVAAQGAARRVSAAAVASPIKILQLHVLWQVKVSALPAGFGTAGGVRRSGKPMPLPQPARFSEHRETFNFSQVTHQGRLPSAPARASIGVGAGTSQCLPGVLANPSVNRTLHSLPPFGLENPSPNAANLFRAGYFKR